MYRERIYTGTLENTASNSTNIKRLPDSNTVSVNMYRTDVLNSCIENFLLECGVEDVEYYPIQGSTDDRKGNLFINGCPFQFYVVGTNTYFVAISGAFSIISGSSSTTVIFNGNQYFIRIILAGNPKSSFGFAIGSSSYGGTAYGMQYLMLYKAKDIVNNEDWIIMINANVSSTYWVTKSDGTRSLNAAQSVNLADASNVGVTSNLMNLFPNKYPLIPKVLGFFRLIDCYNLVSNVSIGSVNYPTVSGTTFAKIGDNVYFQTGSYHGILIDCGIG